MLHSRFGLELARVPLVIWSSPMRRFVPILLPFAVAATVAGSPAGATAQRAATRAVSVSFVSRPAGGGLPRICTLAASGTAFQSMKVRAEFTDFAWSPSGRRLAVVIRSGRRLRVELINANGSGRKLLATGTLDTTAPAKTTGDPAWSPDGRRVAFAADSALYYADSAGKRVRGLTRASEFGGYDTQPQWARGSLYFLRTSYFPTTAIEEVLKPGHRARFVKTLRHLASGLRVSASTLTATPRAG